MRKWFGTRGDIYQALWGLAVATTVLGISVLSGCGGGGDPDLPTPSPSPSVNTSPTPSPSPSFAPITVNRLRLTYTAAAGRTEADLTPVDTADFSCTLTPLGLAISVRSGVNSFSLNVTYPHGSPATGNYPFTPPGEEDAGRPYAQYDRASLTTPGEGNRTFSPPRTPSGSVEILSVSDQQVRLRIKDVALCNDSNSSDIIVANGEVEFDRSNSAPTGLPYTTGKGSVTFGNATGANADTQPMAYGYLHGSDRSGLYGGASSSGGFTMMATDNSGNVRELKVNLQMPVGEPIRVGTYSLQRDQPDITQFPNSPYASVSYRETDYTTDFYDFSGKRYWTNEYSPVRSGTVEVLEVPNAGQGRFRVRLQNVLLTSGEDPHYSGPKSNYGTGSLTVSGEAEIIYAEEQL